MYLPLNLTYTTPELADEIAAFDPKEFNAEKWGHLLAEIFMYNPDIAIDAAAMTLLSTLLIQAGMNEEQRRNATELQLAKGISLTARIYRSNMAPKHSPGF